MTFIDEVKFVALRLWSMRFIVATTAYTTAAGAWVAIPGDWKPELTHVEQMVLAGIGVLLPMLSAVSLVIKQPKLQAKVAERQSVGVES